MLGVLLTIGGCEKVYNNVIKKGGSKLKARAKAMVLGAGVALVGVLVSISTARAVGSTYVTRAVLGKLKDLGESAFHLVLGASRALWNSGDSVTSYLADAERNHPLGAALCAVAAPVAILAAIKLNKKGFFKRKDANKSFATAAVVICGTAAATVIISLGIYALLPHAQTPKTPDASAPQRPVLPKQPGSDRNKPSPLPRITPTPDSGPVLPPPRPKQSSPKPSIRPASKPKETNEFKHFSDSVCAPDVPVVYFDQQGRRHKMAIYPDNDKNHWIRVLETRGNDTAIEMKFSGRDPIRGVVQRGAVQRTCGAQ